MATRRQGVVRPRVEVSDAGDVTAVHGQAPRGKQTETRHQRPEGHLYDTHDGKCLQRVDRAM